IRDWSVTGVQTCALPILIPEVKRRQIRRALDEHEAARRGVVLAAHGKEVVMTAQQIPTEMTAAAIEHFGSPDVVQLERLPIPEEIGRASCRERMERAADV